VLLAVAIWVVWFGALLADTIVLLRVSRISALREHSADVVAVLMLAGYVALLGALLIAFGGIRGLTQRLGFRVTRPWTLLLSPPLWLATLLVGGMLTLPLEHFFGRPPATAAQLLGRARDPFYLAVIVATVCLVAPALEEMFFRGALFGWLRLRAPVPVAAFVSATIFGAVHLTPLLLPYLVLFGVVASYVYEKTGSTVNTFVMHACQNSVALAAAYALSG
jgi:membrane protease YdiL (CAAX protease family)